MELNRKINVIWYGRGDLDDECNSFNLETHKDKILEVYRVSGGEGGSTHQNGWEIYVPAEDTGTFDQLECGNLYIIILHDDATLDVPEAVVSYGGTGVGENVTEVLPNDIVPSPTATETDPGDCAPTGAIVGIETSESGDTTRSLAIDNASTTVAYMLPSVASNVTRFLFHGCNLENVGNSDQATLTLNMNGSAMFTLTNVGATGGTVYVEVADSSTEPANGCWSADIPSDALAGAIELVKQDGNVEAQPSPTQTETPSDSATATATATPSATATATPEPVVASEETCFAFANAEGGAYRIQWMADGTENNGTWKLSKSDGTDLTIEADADTSDNGWAKSFAKDTTDGIIADSGNVLNLSFCFFFNIAAATNQAFDLTVVDQVGGLLDVAYASTGIVWNVTVTSRRAWRGGACHIPDPTLNTFEF